MANKTRLYKRHQELGARIVEFAGYLMPVQYEGIMQEHQAVREKAGLFDVSHMGEIMIAGPQALDLIQYLTTNNAARLRVNQVQYTFLCYPDGGVVDDILVYRLQEKVFMLVVNASNADKDLEWVKEHSTSFPGAQVEDQSDNFGLLALQGPLAARILSFLTTYDLASIKYYWSVADVEVAGTKVLLSRTGYTGEDGFELYVAPHNIEKVFDSLLEAGGKLGLKPAGLGARDTLRLEAGMPLYGHELSPGKNPLEARLGFFVDFSKEDFIGKDALLKIKKAGVAKKLVGFEVEGRRVPRQGYPLVHEGQQVGEVTSGTFSPTLRKSLGMGYLPPALAEVGNEVGLDIRGKIIEAKVVPLPFYKRGDK